MRALWLIAFASLACSRKHAEIRAEVTPAVPDVALEAAPSTDAVEAFLKVVEPALPKDAYLREPASVTPYAPKGFDPLTAPGAAVTRMPDGSEVRVFEHDAGSDVKSYVAIVRGGKVVARYEFVARLAIDPGGRLALVHAKKVWLRELVDVTTLASTPLPRMPCTEGALSFVGERLLTHGYRFDEPYVPHAFICLFDRAGKLVVHIDAGVHNHHAAAGDFINMTAGVLPSDPDVVWATREYESYGDYDLALVDARPPHARRVARLSTGLPLGSPSNLQIDLAKTTLGSAIVRYRGAAEGAWLDWQTARLHPR